MELKKRGGISRDKRNLGKKLWYFLWDSDSIWSWIVDLILLWLIIKFILFPTMAFITGAPLPSVIIESGSLQHQANCGLGEKLNFDSWWQNHESIYSAYNISKTEFLNFVYPDGLSIGDIIILNGRNKNNFKVGDIIVYNAGQAKPIIHRIVAVVNNNGLISYETLGDNNCGQFNFEKSISQEQVIGKAIARIPKVGMIKIWVIKGIDPVRKLFRR